MSQRATKPRGWKARPMLAILHLLLMFVGDIFKSRRRLEAENLFLHHQRVASFA
jgi:hypothetical protein